MYIPKKMKDQEFKFLGKLVEEYCGIRMPSTKKLLLTSRLNKRLRELEFDTFMEYYQYIMTPLGKKEEIPLMIDQVTTNKTDFFREASHFDQLRDSILPYILSHKPSGEILQVWSAGCSSGEEVYTLGMVLSEYFEQYGGWSFSILGTDICSDVLDAAYKGIYTEKDVAPVSDKLKQKYLMKGKGQKKGLYRIVPELRARTEFKYLNLIDWTGFDMSFKLDIIFCRNVVIYFERDTQQVLFENFFRQLKPGGFLFIGHSETLHGINDQFVAGGISVYRKPE